MVVFLTAMNVADAQLHHPHLGGSMPGAGGLATGGQSAFRQVRGDVQAGIPGRFWFEANVADEGLGYNGSYLTVGGKRRLYEDFLDGRWLLEGQAHHSIDENEGDFFANIGIERVFSIPAAGADVSIGGWYDYNGETKADFSNPFHQVGISGAIKSRRWDLLANGYFPIGDTDVTLGDPSGQTPFADIFAQNFLLSEIGVDAAQTGFDVTMRLRPKQLAFANGTIDFGGYGYKSDQIEFFGGGRVRVGFQALRGAIVSAEVNHDDRFNTTGVLSVGWIFGSNGGVGGEYAGLARDLEPTLRNDHIVRVTNEAAFVINPVTGLPYNVLHVNNQGGASGSGDGTFERPFLTLLEAEAAGAEGDAIFVDSGDGTSRNYQNGIELKTNQLLLGDGGTYGVPDAANGGLFQITTDGGTGPTITNPGELSVVELADNNRIAGVNIDGTGATHGINGEVINGGTFEDVTVQNATQNGVRLFNVFGNWDFRDNNFSNNSTTGLMVDGSFNPAATFLLSNNTANNNLSGHGIHFHNTDAESIILNGNTTNGNVGNGLFFEDFINTAGNGLNILNHVADSNIGAGINILRGNGKLNIFNPNVTNNAGGGIHITDWTNVAGENTVITGFDGTIATIDGNGQGPNNVQIELTQPGLMQNVLITEALIANGNGIGIAGTASGIDTILNMEIRDNVTVSGNFNGGIAISAFDGATVNTVIGNPANALPDVLIQGNAESGGVGLSLIAQGIDAQPPARLNAVVSNVQIQNAEDPFFSSVGFLESQGTGIDIQSLDNAVVDITIVDSNIGAPANNVVDGETLNVNTGVNINLNNSGNELINSVLLDNLNLIVGDTDAAGGNGGVGVNISTSADTLSDITIRNSLIVPNNIISADGARGDDNVFTDAVGFVGISASISGEATTIGGGYLAGPGPGFNAQGFVGRDAVSDGVLDNLTRLTIQNNVIRDFTFQGIDISTTGDAQLLLAITGNQVLNNGAGDNADTDGDNIFFEENGDGVAPAPTSLLFYDGINIDAFEDSQISATIVGNLIQDNFEAGLSINTFQRAEVNAIVEANTFDSNDRGASIGVAGPLLAIGVDRGEFLGPAPFAGSFDIELINNEEYYFRPFETPVFTVETGDDNGMLVDPLTGMLLEGDGTAGIDIPGNTGMDIFGNPVPIGTADLNVILNNNAVDLAVNALDFSLAPGDLLIGLDGTNETLPVIFPQPETTRTAVQGAIDAEESLFEARGF